MYISFITCDHVLSVKLKQQWKHCLCWQNCILIQTGSKMCLFYKSKVQFHLQVISKPRFKSGFPEGFQKQKCVRTMQHIHWSLSMLRPMSVCHYWTIRKQGAKQFRPENNQNTIGWTHIVFLLLCWKQEILSLAKCHLKRKYNFWTRYYVNSVIVFMVM